MTKEIGITIGSITPNKLVFATKERLNLGDYVYVKDEIEGKEREIVAKISDLIFMDLSSLSTASPALGTPREVMFELLKTSEFDKTFMTGQSVVLGYVSDDLTLKPVKTIIRPGLNVFVPPRELLKQIITPKTILPVHIGTLSSRPDVDVYLAGEKFLAPTLITGMTGTGKTTFSTILTREMAKQDVFSVIFDLSGEYENISSKEWVNYVPSTQLGINFSSLTPSQIARLIEASEYQENIIFDAFQRFRKFESINDFLEALTTFNRGYASKRAADSIAFKLRALDEKGIFSSKGIRNEDLHKPYTVTILALSTMPQRIRDLLVYLVVEQMFRENVPRHYVERFKFLVFDNVLNVGDLFIEAMLKIARMGRRSRTGLCMITQSPSLLPVSLSSACENLVAFRMVNRRDIERTAEIYGEEALEIIGKLQPTEAYLCGPFVTFPIVAKVKVVESFVA